MIQSSILAYFNDDKIYILNLTNDTVVVKKKYKFDKKKYKSGQKNVQVGQKKVQIRQKKYKSKLKWIKLSSYFFQIVFMLNFIYFSLMICNYYLSHF